MEIKGKLSTNFIDEFRLITVSSQARTPAEQGHKGVGII